MSIVGSRTIIYVGANQNWALLQFGENVKFHSDSLILLCEDDVSCESFLSFNFRVLVNKRNNKVSLFLPWFFVPFLLFIEILLDVILFEISHFCHDKTKKTPFLKKPIQIEIRSIYDIICYLSLKNNISKHKTDLWLKYSILNENKKALPPRPHESKQHSRNEVMRRLLL